MDERSVILTGFMGTGKSTVGRMLAGRLGLEFVDTDALIEARSGRRIAEIFHEEGELAFRRLEAQIARELAGRRGLVIATGGRMMLDPANEAALGQDAHIFCLTAEPEQIIARLATDAGKRPLLDVPDPAGRIRELLAQRAERYGRFNQIKTDGKTSRQIVEEIISCISVM